MSKKEELLDKKIKDLVEKTFEEVFKKEVKKILGK